MNQLVDWILNKDDNILLIIKCVPDIINNILAKAKYFIDANASILLPKTHVFTLIEQPQPQHHQLISSKQTKHFKKKSKAMRL